MPNNVKDLDEANTSAVHDQSSVSTQCQDFESEEEFQQHVTDELKQSSAYFSQHTSESAAPRLSMDKRDSWQIASDMVSQFRPVPLFMWSIIHRVLGIRQKVPLGERKVESGAFFALAPLILAASHDKTLSHAISDSQKATFLSDATRIIGDDVAAAVCFMHAVCRRITVKLPEKLWRPIMDDALLRAQIGFHVGTRAKPFGTGRGMLAGFSGRSGLAIQMAAGSRAEANEVLVSLAGGANIDEVGNMFFGCDPLQVSAMALVAAGCGRDAALGIAGFNSRTMDMEFRSEKSCWLTAFTVIERLRMGEAWLVDSEDWEELQYDENSKEDLKKSVNKLLRQGHSWQWMLVPQLDDDQSRTDL